MVGSLTIHLTQWLIDLQDPFYLDTTILDSSGWPLDSLEDSTHQGRSRLGLANQASHHCRV